MYTLLKFLEQKSPQWALMHAFVSAIAIDIRLPGLLGIVLTITLLIFENYHLKEKSWKNLLGLITLYLTTSIFFIILFWPALWKNPFTNFIVFYKSMSHYHWSKDLLYMGQWFSPYHNSLPWHYLPVWIAISTPICTTLLFMTGIISFLNKPIAYTLDLRGNRFFIIALVWFFAPLLSIILLHSTLYNGWRHVFFIYPVLILIALKGFCWIKEKWGSLLITTAVAFNIATTTIFLIYSHPYQMLYFNQLAGKDLNEVKNNFSIDTLVVEFKEGLEYLLKTEPKRQLFILDNSYYLEPSLWTLSPEDQKRIYFVFEPLKAEFIFLNYIEDKKRYNNLGNKIYAKSINNFEVLSIYKMEKTFPF
jgi:hypothetical protein